MLWTQHVYNFLKESTFKLCIHKSQASSSTNYLIPCFNLICLSIKPQKVGLSLTSLSLLIHYFTSFFFFFCVKMLTLLKVDILALVVDMYVK